MTKTDVTDCRKCHYALPGRKDLQCLAMEQPKPVDWMRREENECGPNATMFEPKTSAEAKYGHD